MEKKYDVFISYAHEDKNVETLVEEALRRDGLDVFSDTEDIRAGDQWLPKLAEAIDQSCIFLALISSAYCGSKYSIKEFRLANMAQEEGQVKIVPYLIDDGIPTEIPADIKMELTSLQWITWSEIPPERNLGKTIKNLLRGGFIKKEFASPPKVLENHCINHPNRGVAARCIYCGKNLCTECATKYESDNTGQKVPMCDNCVRQHNETIETQNEEAKKAAEERKNNKISKFILKFICSFIVFAVCMLSFPEAATWARIVMIMLSFIPFGFRAIGESYDPRNHPDNNPGCLGQLVIGAVGGIFLFFRDLFDLFKDEENSSRPAD